MNALTRRAVAPQPVAVAQQHISGGAAGSFPKESFFRGIEEAGSKKGPSVFKYVPILILS
jgi:hypothetical protein